MRLAFRVCLSPAPLMCSGVPVSLLVTLIALFSVLVVATVVAACFRWPGRRRSKNASAEVLSYLSDHCCSTQEEIQAGTGLDAPVLLSAVEELRARGEVERRVDRRDPSVLQHHLVKRGRGTRRCHGQGLLWKPVARTGASSSSPALGGPGPAPRSRVGG